MRMILGLDEPTSGSVTVNGRPPRAHAAPLHEVGSALYLAVAGLLGLALGALLRSTAGGIATLFGLLFVLPATSLGAWTGFGVFCAYAAVLLGCAAVRMRRGDA